MLRCILVVIAILIGGSGCEFEEDFIVEDIYYDGTDIGIQRLMDWQGQANFHNQNYHQFSSHSLEESNYPPLSKDGNKDNNNILSVCGNLPPISNMNVADPSGEGCEPGMKGYLIAKHDGGPGYISRIWFTTFFPGMEQLKIYVDDMTTPVYLGTISEWGEKHAYPFSLPLAGPWSGSFLSYVPISFKKSVRVLFNQLETSPLNLYFYHVNIQTHNEETIPFNPANFKHPPTVVGETGKDKILANSMFNNSGLPPIQPTGIPVEADIISSPASVTNLISQLGPATINQMEFELDSRASLSELNKMQLLIYFDQNEKAAIDIPLAPFLGLYQGNNEYYTLPISHRINKYGKSIVNFHLPMPFSESVEINLINNSESNMALKLTVNYLPYVPKGEWGKLHATHNHIKAANTPINSLYTVASIKGRGKFVGTIMYMSGQNEDPAASIIPDYQFSFLEGDEFISIDGDSTPRIQGTGTEDFFNGAFYFRDGIENFLFSAINVKESLGNKGRTTVQRWNVLSDAIEFQNSFHFDLEYSNNNLELVDEYRSVGFYYLEK